MLQAERTPGGHRRIYITELRRLIAANRGAAPGAPLAFWLKALLSGDAGKVKAALVAARETAESFAETADAVAAALAEIGRRWEAGACAIFEERAASEALRRAAASCASEIRAGPGAPCAALLTSKVSATLWACRSPSLCWPRPAGARSGLARDLPARSSPHSWPN